MSDIEGPSVLSILVDAATGDWKSLNEGLCNADLPLYVGVGSIGEDGEVQYLHYR